MIYMLSSVVNTYGILLYDHANSPDYTLFHEGMSLKSITSPYIYTVKKKSDISKLKKLHFFRSTGPDVVSASLRKVIEEIAPTEVEFFDASITCNGEAIDGFSCMNPIWKLPCIDMDKSEYERTNFDPNNPKYSFLYTALLDATDPETKIARCIEQPVQIVVNGEIKDACKKAGLSGLEFFRANDMTYNNRTVSESI